MCAEARAYACQDEAPVLGQLSSGSFDSRAIKCDDLAEADPSQFNVDPSMTDSDPPEVSLP
jgi:hypothetical protein